MTVYRRFDFADCGKSPATVAKVATLQAEEPRTVANVATVAGAFAENSASEGRSVANVASVATADEKTEGSASGPHGWREALLALSPDHDPCPGFRPGAWARVWAEALDFLHRHGAEAARLGWTDVELCGVHPVVGVIRVDHCGALMLSVSGRVASVEAEAIRYMGGLVYRRLGAPAAAVPVWKFGGS